MRLLCIGDVAISDNKIIENLWIPPLEFSPNEETKILFNWELPIGDVINSCPRDCGGDRLLSSSRSIEYIKQWSPGFAALATNHILDAGIDGLSKTISSLQREGFTTLGAGMTFEEISKPLIWETKEGKLAIINWVFPEAHPDWLHVPGPNCWPGIDEAKRIIELIKPEVDWLMVLAHWSDELFPYPRPKDRQIARELGNIGVDILISHHPHVVRGMESFGSCPVFYSIGNFYFSDFLDNSGEWTAKWSRRNRESLGVLISFTKELSPSFEVLSFFQMKNRTKVDHSGRAIKRMKQNSLPLDKLNFEEYSKWYSSKRRIFFKWEARWHFGICRLGFFGSIEFIMKKIKRKMNFLSRLNFKKSL